MFCTNCGKELRDEWKRCPYCGTKIEDNDFKKETDFKEETVLAREFEEAELAEKFEETEESEKQDFNGEEYENQGELHTYEILAVRRSGKYWTRYILTNVEIDGDKVIVDKGKKREKSFHLRDLKSHHFTYEPIWWKSDFIRIIIFALLMPFS